MKFSKCKFSFLAIVLTLLLINSGIRSNVLYRNYNFNLEISGYWDLTSIFIDDSNPTADWAFTSSNYDWCTGSGTLNDPYLIENVTIDRLGSGSCIRIIKSTGVYFKIKNCTISNSGLNIEDGGIKLENTNNGFLINNTIEDCLNGINLYGNCDYNFISNNYITGGLSNGIYFYSGCDNNTIFNNTVDSHGTGFYMSNCNENNFTGNLLKYNSFGVNWLTSSHNLVDKNEFAYNYYGLQLRSCEYNTISGNYFAQSTEDGLYLNGANWNSIINNNFNDNGEDGVMINGNYNKFINNTMKYNTFNGLSCSGTNNVIANNAAEFNSIDGFSFNLQNSNITGNTSEFNSGDGFSLNLQNSNITGNTAFSNNWHGMDFNVDDSYIANNNISYNLNRGLYLRSGSNNNEIVENHVERNGNGGIYLTGANLNNIEENLALNNTKFGIRLSFNSDNNNISKNDLYYNFRSISFNPDSEYNLIFGNNIISNILSAEDHSGYNDWNNSIIGNYWDNYIGKDSDDDGIGDTPFSIGGGGGAYDYKPLFWDSIDFDIEKPFIGQNYGLIAPNYSITINEGVFHSLWYSLDDGNNISTVEPSGKINQSSWNNFDDGTISIKFYLNDSAGIEVFNEVTVIKDTIVPKITILSPELNQLCGMDSPEFSLLINEINLLETWYSINGGENVTFTTENKLDQEAWDKVINGTVTIKFYAKDYAGNVGFQEVEVIKDIPPQPENAPVVPGANLLVIYLTLFIGILVLIWRRDKKIKH